LEWTGFNDEAVKMAGHWFKVEDSDMAANRHRFVYGVEKDIWSVNSDGYMQYRQEVTPANHRGDSWTRIDNRLWLESVGNYDRTQTIGINEENYIFYREGVERDHMQGRIWSPIKGLLKHGRIGFGKVLWGIDTNDRVVAIYLEGELPECNWQ